MMNDEEGSDEASDFDENRQQSYVDALKQINNRFNQQKAVDI